MKLAEMEAHHDACADLENRIQIMVQNCEFPAVFSVCVASFEHILPAINVRKKRGILSETTGFVSFSTICQFAPPLFELAPVESLEAFVRSSRVLVQHEDDYLSSIQAAQWQGQLACNLWNHLIKNPGTLQRSLGSELGVIQQKAVEIVEFWESLGIVDRHLNDGSPAIWFRTRLDAETQGLCPECDAHGQGRKELFLKSTKCKRCGSNCYYYIEYDAQGNVKNSGE